MNREFTASVYLIDNKQVLLINHSKLQKWLPPGGHLEADETPVEAARREVFEETGLEIEFQLQENVWINCWNAKSIERPYLCLIENIPIYCDTPSHQHIDFIYVARPIQSANASPLAHHLYQWFSWEDLMRMEPDRDIFQETLDIIKHLFTISV